MPNNFGFNSFSGILLYLTSFLGAFLAALWLSLIFWTYRDIHARTQDRFIQILATLIVAILNLPGLIIYLILRPSQTLDEGYQRTLEEEALLSSIEDHSICPGCGLRIQSDWQVCPQCHTLLRKPCINCGRLMQLSWQICPYCGILAPGVPTENEKASEETSNEEE
jgi:RNA polymerase subunit RPABC4/transcription elongation factor Spt4